MVLSGLTSKEDNVRTPDDWVAGPAAVSCAGTTFVVIVPYLLRFGSKLKPILCQRARTFSLRYGWASVWGEDATWT